MGYEFRPRAKFFRFYSQKSESFLRHVIGCRVWVIAGTPTGTGMSYRLAGMFTPSAIRPENGGFDITGAGVPFRPPIEVSALPWFKEWFLLQRRFSFGFSRIHKAKIMAELNRLLEQYGGELLLKPDEVAVASLFFEGATSKVSVDRYERNPYARQKCIRHYGCRCSVGGFDFKANYGEVGRNFIHVHHLKPLSENGQKYEIDPIADLRPICPNCHAMIHRNKKMMTIRELRKLIQMKASS